MIDKHTLHERIKKVLAALPFKDGPEVVELLMGTVAHESLMGKYTRQLGNGPARGIGQMEPATEHDIWENYLTFRPSLVEIVKQITGRTGPGPWLEDDVDYDLVMMRLKYRRAPGKIPLDLAGQAAYWKEHYNTAGGKGTVAEYLEHYKEFLEDDGNG